jgi:peptidoglycan/LPS O-acetylase OafA/YrhL
MSSETGLGHRPGLDGLRAIALAAILLFHGDVTWMRGAFLSVTLFFVLSGFLVTSLLIGEHARRDRIRLGTFWARRARRLLPSALLTIGAVIVATPHFGDVGQRAALRGDALAATGYVANWRFLLTGAAYDVQFSGKSPLLHFWSLAIEEQFYVIWPLVAALVFGRTRARLAPTSRLAAAVAVMIGLSAVSCALSSSADRSYYGTDTRAGEFLVGALLAVGVASPRTRDAVTRAARLAPAALATIGSLWFFARLDDAWLQRGGRIGVAVLCALLVAAGWGDGRVSRLFGLAPLQAMGRASYTIYLVHWPVFLILDVPRTGLEGVALFALRIAVSFSIAAVIYHLYECPLRFRRWIRVPRWEFAGAAVATVAVAFGATIATADARPVIGEGDFVVERAPLAEPTLDVVVVGGGTELPEALRGGEVRSVDHVDLRDCPIAPADALRAPGAAARETRAVSCADPTHAWTAAAARRADVVVVASVRGDLDDARVDGAWTNLERLDRLSQTRAALDGVVRAARREGAVVVLVAPVGDGRAALLRGQFDKAAADALGATLATSAHRRVVLAAAAAAAREARPPWPLPFGSRAPSPLRVLVVGDSTSFWIASGLEAAATERGDVTVAWLGAAGCPSVRADEFRSVFADTMDLSDCPRFDTDWVDAARAFGPDVVLVVASVIDAGEYQIDGDERWVGFGDASFDEFWRNEADAALASLAESGAVVVWADAPGVQLVQADASRRWNVRLARLNELVRALDADHPQVTTIALTSRLGLPGAEIDREQRPDGAHLAPEAAADLAREWLVDELLLRWQSAVRDSISIGCMHGGAPRPEIVLARCATPNAPSAAGDQ